MQNELSISDIFDHKLPRLLPENPDVVRRINSVIGVEITGDGGGCWTLDLTENPVIEQGKTKESKCTISTTADDFMMLLTDGSIRHTLQAFKEKRIQVTGHLPTILKLESLLRSLTNT